MWHLLKGAGLQHCMRHVASAWHVLVPDSHDLLPFACPLRVIVLGRFCLRLASGFPCSTGVYLALCWFRFVLWATNAKRGWDAARLQAGFA